ncbi:MAG: hypothetical protein WC781_05760, partial [Candidatus Pacearchaeota archaeon]
TKLSPREAFISILTGNGKREPRLFNKPQELVKIEADKLKQQFHQESQCLAEAKQNQEKKQVQEAKENYWLTISNEKKQEYLRESKNDLNKAIELANSRVCTDHEEFSLTKILESLNNIEQATLNNTCHSATKEFKKIEGHSKGHVQFFANNKLTFTAKEIHKDTNALPGCYFPEVFASRSDPSGKLQKILDVNSKKLVFQEKNIIEISTIHKFSGITE